MSRRRSHRALPAARSASPRQLGPERLEPLPAGDEAAGQHERQQADEDGRAAGGNQGGRRGAARDGRLTQRQDRQASAGVSGWHGVSGRARHGSPARRSQPVADDPCRPVIGPVAPPGSHQPAARRGPAPHDPGPVR
jgi:hypothetical protein